MLQQPEAASPAGYRADIDGLRAVAVLLVVASHLGTRPTGGYIGVDVFFVISGYLISASILSEMQSGRFSIAAFYERRIRRIFPALLVMLFVVSILAYIYLLPVEMLEYARSLLGALASGSNFLFWHEGGYFDSPSALKPLLHTWSLGVEEQFYILFPIFLVVMRRWFPKRLQAGIYAIAAISLVAACRTVQHDDAAAFYFAPLRAWELLIGTIISQRYLPAPRSAVGRNLMTGIGLALIVAPAILYTPDTRFPGLTALPPCLGAALLIAGGDTGSSLVGRLLSWTPIRFIGLISYSLYLWHWPVIVFRSSGSFLLYANQWPEKLVKLVLLGISIVLATLSWRFVERPFRKGRWRPNRLQLFSLAGGATVALALIAVAMVTRNGFPNRLPPDARHVAEYLVRPPESRPSEKTCFVLPSNTFADFDTDRCLTPTSGEPSILVAGDSHSAMLIHALAETFPDRSILQASASDCPPMVVRVSGRSGASNCASLNDFLFNDYLLHQHVGTLLLVARWRSSDIPGIAATIAFTQLHNIPAVLVGPSVEYDASEPRLLAIALWKGNVQDVPKHALPGPRELDHQLSEMARTVWHVPYISIYDDLCQAACPLYATGSAPLVYDGNHLSGEGALLLAHIIRDRHQLP